MQIESQKERSIVLLKRGPIRDNLGGQLAPLQIGIAEMLGNGKLYDWI